MSKVNCLQVGSSIGNYFAVVRTTMFETRLKSYMKKRLMPLSDKLLLRKRAIIESITD